MAGKFLERDAIIATIKTEERMNAKQNRSEITKYHVYAVPCGCSDPNCGAFHRLWPERPLPTKQQALETLAKNSQARKAEIRDVHA